MNTGKLLYWILGIILLGHLFIAPRTINRAIRSQKYEQAWITIVYSLPISFALLFILLH